MVRTNARVRYTRHVLKESFLTLLQEKPVNRITVRELCERAELNRATFYAHYADCFDLMDSIEQELVDAFGETLTQVGAPDVRSLIEAIYRMVDRNERACRVLIFEGASTSVLGRMIDLARTAGLEYWRRQLPHATENDLEMLYTHLSNGLMNVIVGGYYRYDREEVIRFASDIVRVSLALFR